MGQLPKKRLRSTENFIDTPQFPGWQKGMTQKQVQDFIKDQVRRKGFNFSGGTTPTDFKIQLSGSARFMYGLAFKNDIGVCSLTVNNEIIFENVDTKFLLFGQTQNDYYACNRPLSGQDDITLTITGTAGFTNEPVEIVYK